MSEIYTFSLPERHISSFFYNIYRGEHAAIPLAGELDKYSFVGQQQPLGDGFRLASGFLVPSGCETIEYQQPPNRHFLLAERTSALQYIAAGCGRLIGGQVADFSERYNTLRVAVAKIQVGEAGSP